MFGQASPARDHAAAAVPLDVLESEAKEASEAHQIASQRSESEQEAMDHLTQEAVIHRSTGGIGCTICGP